ncbi:MAG: chorismate synthase [Desulfovibrio sp.]|nr:chorismate synthase [Desulfovibrio sp.]
MSGNTFGRALRLTTFGESHGPGLGGILDGCPAGLPIDEDAIQAELDARKPGSGLAGTKRRESDKLEILSGVFNGLATGTPIGFYIKNENARSGDYGNLEEIFRPGHADWSYYKKYNGVRDHRGGGRASGRETAARVVGGAIAKQILSRLANVRVEGACVELGGIAVREEDINLAGAMERPYFAAADYIVAAWDEAVREARESGDTLGGIARIVARDVPAGLGEPVFDRLDATLAHAIMSVGAVKGVEIGSGFAAARSRGSRNNDPLYPAGSPGRAVFGSNNAGGILGGVSSGQDIIIQAALKPIASISIEQDTINKRGEAAKIKIGGRHDLSALPRALPVLSAMTALAIADALLLQRRMDIIPYER